MATTRIASTAVAKSVVLTDQLTARVWTAKRSQVRDPRRVSQTARDGQEEAVTDKGATLTARDQAWLKLGGPVYQQLRQRDGRRPTEKTFHEALTQALAVQTGQVDGLDGQQAGLEILDDSVSLSTAKRVRVLVESRGVPVRERTEKGGDGEAS